jgi:hypothetical protein
VLLFWQIPHFMAIAWLYRSDYAAAHFPMLSVRDGRAGRWPGGRWSARSSSLSVSLLPTLLGFASAYYLAVAVVAGVWFVGRAVNFLRPAGREFAARRLFLRVARLSAGPARHAGGRPLLSRPMTVHDIPAVNATLNGLATVLITAGFIFVKQGRRDAHRACMLTAAGVSALFLVGYVTHKALMHGIHTPFGGAGFIRGILLHDADFAHRAGDGHCLPRAAHIRFRAPGKFRPPPRLGPVDVSALVLRERHGSAGVLLPLPMVARRALNWHRHPFRCSKSFSFSPLLAGG